MSIAKSGLSNIGLTAAFFWAGLAVGLNAATAQTAGVTSDVNSTGHATLTSKVSINGHTAETSQTDSAGVVVSPTPCKWVAIIADTLPNREHLTGSNQWFRKPEPDSGALHEKAVVGKLYSRTLQQYIADILIDCDPGMDPDKSLVTAWDFTRSGDFINSKRIIMEKSPPNPKRGHTQYNSEGTVINTEINGEVRPVNVRLQYWRFGGNDRYVWGAVGTALESRITLDGNEYIIQFCDGDGNLECTDRTTKESMVPRGNLADMVRLLDPANPQGNYPLALGLYDEPVLVRGKLYKFTLDDKRIAHATEIPTETGTIDMPDGLWRIGLARTEPSKAILYYVGFNGKNAIPAGKYILYSYVLWKEIGKTRYVLVVRPRQEVEVTTDKPLVPDLKLKLEIMAKLSGRTLQVSSDGSEILGIYISGEKNGDLGEPVIECIDTDGNVFASYNMDINRNNSFILPPNFPFQFKVRMVWPDSPFEFESIPVEIDADKGVNYELPSL